MGVRDLLSRLPDLIRISASLHTCLDLAQSERPQQLRMLAAQHARTSLRSRPLLVEYRASLTSGSSGVSICTFVLVKRVLLY